MLTGSPCFPVAAQSGATSAATAAAPPRCLGDCDGDSTVSISELLIGVNIALGTIELASCPAFDATADSDVTVDEILAAVNAALNGCPEGPLAASPSQLCFSGLVNSQIASKQVTIERAVGSWIATADAPWLTVTPSAGQPTDTLQVGVDIKGLGDGTGAGHVSISDKSGRPPLTILVELSLYSPAKTAGWTVQTVEAAGNGDNSDKHTSLALDPDGRVAMTNFRDDAEHYEQLRYAHWTGCGWETELVDAYGFHASLAIDRNGQPNIAYYDGRAGVLRYAQRQGQTWNIITLDDQNPNGQTGTEPSLALDASDRPRISYQLKFRQGVFTYDLRYAEFDGTTWRLETLDSQGATGWGSSLALSALGDPRITYYDDTTFTLKYAHRTNGQWQLEPIGTGGRISSLRLDSSEQPLVAYDGFNPNFFLQLASRHGQWTAETVDPSNGNQWVSLALDSAGTPHIAYGDADTNTVNYASRLSSGEWAIKVIDESPSLGRCSLQIDRNDVAHLSYRDLAGRVLKYATGPAVN